MPFDLAELPEPLRSRAVAAAGSREQLEAMIEQARSTHPGLTFAQAAYAAHVMARVPPEADVVAHLQSVHAPDLLIAHRCAAGDNAAIVAFERRCFDEIPFAVARVRPRATVDEIAQAMRDRLFVPKGDAPPKILQYSGAGDLRGWFRVVLMRHLLNEVKRVNINRETDLDDAMLEVLPAAVTDPELDHARRQYAP